MATRAPSWGSAPFGTPPPSSPPPLGRILPRSLVAPNVPVLSGGDSTAHCNHDTNELVYLNTPVMGSRKRRGLLGGHGKTTLTDLSLPVLSGGKSTQKCNDDDLIALSVPILSDRGEAEE